MKTITGGLNESFQTTLNGSGNGTLTIGPQYTYQTWVPTLISVSLSSNVKEPVLKYYRGRSIGSILGGTYTPSNDQSDVSGQILNPGETFFFVWTGGDAGATAFVTLNGDIQIP